MVEIIIAADSGQAGEKAAKEVSKITECKYIAAESPIGNTPNNYDFNDLHQESGIDAVKKALKTTAPIITRGNGLTITKFNRNEKLKPLQWLIKGVLLKNSLNMLIAPHGVGKTFLGIAIGGCLTTERNFFEHKVNQKYCVVFIAGEGIRGIKLRLLAWLKSQKIDSNNIDFYISNRAADLYSNPKNLIEELESLDVKIDLIIYDTLNRNTPGVNENDTKDMSEVIRSIDTINIDFDCASLIIHHTPHNTPKRGRGSSALVAAVDTELLLERVGSNSSIKQVKLSCTKMKDSEPMKEILLQSRKITVEVNDDDEPLATTIVFEHTNAGFIDSCPNLGKNQQLLFDAIKSLNLDNEKEWTNLKQAYSLSKIDTRRRKEALDGLIRLKLIKVRGEKCKIIS